MFGIIKRIINWSGEYKKRIYLGFVLAFFAGIFMSMPIMLAAIGIEYILADMNGSKTFGYREVLLFTGLLILSVVGRFLFSFFKAKLQDTVIYERLSDERIKIGDVLKRVNLGFFSENETGNLVSAVTTDLSFMEMHAMSMLDMVVNGYITTAVMILCCFSIDPVLGFIMVGGLVVSAVFLHIMGVCSTRNSKVLHEANEDMIGTTIEYLRGIALVKAFHQEGVTADGIKRAYEKSKNINIKIEVEYAICNFFHMASLKIAAAAMVIYSAVMTYNGNMQLAMMVFTDILSFVVFASTESLGSAFHVLHVIDNTLDKLDKLIGAQFIDETGKRIDPESYEIEFDKVTFAYEKKDVLKNVSFKIPEGKFTAIVGPSGSGKTTICNLIARFYDVTSGRILLDGRDLREYSCDSILKQISMVFQNVYLFHDSILNNIRFGKPDATLEEVIEVAKRARCHDFISELPDGYDTVIGEGGSSLSGGQKQRISIARAMLKDAPIIILDEATSSVDPENEHLIQNAISELVKGKTVIAIAHRLPTIENADQILVIQDGMLVQSGAHKELVEQEGVYSSFINIRQKSENWSL